MFKAYRIFFAVMGQSAKDLFANVKQISLVEGVNDDEMNVIQIPAKTEENAYLELHILVCIVHTFSFMTELGQKQNFRFE